GLLVHRLRRSEIPAGTSYEGQPVEGRGNTRLVAYLPGEGETLSAQRRGTSVMPLVVGKDARAGQSLGTSTDEVRHIGRHLQRLVQPSTAFGQIAACVPEMPDGGA